MEEYEIVVVGAGPGGLKCAEVLAKAGKKVILLEKNKVIGPKVCAGGITCRDREYMGFPENLTEFRFKEATIYTPHISGALRSEKYFVYTINRKTLGQWQLRQLRKTKAVVKTNSMVTDIGKNYVVVNNSKKIKFKYLVGADGSLSVVRKHLGLKTEKFGLAVQYLVKTKKYKKMEMFLDSNLFKEWYAWIFPHKGHVAIGCGGNPKLFPTKDMLKNLDLWLKEKNIDVSKATYQAHTINASFRGYRFGNVFLIGDAAGLTPAFTGKGIYPAMASGNEVAKMIIDKNYVSKEMERLIRIEKEQSDFVRNLGLIGPLKGVVQEWLVLLLKIKCLEKTMLNRFLE